MSTESPKEVVLPKTTRQRVSIAIAALDLPGTSQIIIGDDDTKEENEEKMAGSLPSLFRTHSLDSGKAKIVSVPTIEEIKHSTSDLVEEVVVPSRDALISYPFYSTPLSLESTNNAFRDFMVRLNEMGFKDEAEAALIATNAESVESAVDFIYSHPLLSFHRFAPNDDLLSISVQSESAMNGSLDQLCTRCGLSKRDHIIDEIGNLIDKSMDDDEAFGDLNGRLSMSVATRQQREEQKLTLQQMIDNKRNPPSIIEEKEEKEYAGPTEQCMICFDDRPVDMFYEASCGHNYCKICLSNHYKIKTNDGDVLKLSCIDPNCDRLIEEDEILKFLIGDELIAKFKRFRQQKLLMLNPNVRFCCKPDCEGTMTGSRLNRKLVCPICSTAVCYNCSQPWHGYFVGCNQNIDIGYAKWALNKDVQKCPKCRMGIEKEDGCNHMTCYSCKYEFCWICKGPYNDYHFEWWNIFGCPGAQYTPRFCRCPVCFPRWFNRILIILCFLAVVMPLVFTAGVCWLLIVCLIFCIRCEFSCDVFEDVCDCF